MELKGLSTAVTGGASGLGLATARRIADAGGHVTLIDLPNSDGAAAAEELGATARFAPADVTDAEQFAAALDIADAQGGLRALVHCAGAGRRMRILDNDGKAGSARGLRVRHPAQPGRVVQRAARWAPSGWRVSTRSTVSAARSC